jgi:Flp pilus assembly pilin Flp
MRLRSVVRCFRDGRFRHQVDRQDKLDAVGLAMSTQNTFLTSDSGATAVEFGLVLPGLAILIVGTLYAGLVMYSIAGLHTAVEEGARCYSVNSGSCGSASAAQTYAPLLRAERPDILSVYAIVRPSGHWNSQGRS